MAMVGEESVKVTEIDWRLGGGGGGAQAVRHAVFNVSVNRINVSVFKVNVIMINVSLFF